MKPPILLYSDVHFHNWDAFSVVRDDVNSRLQIIIDELRRAYDHLHAQGGDTAYCAGDLFHVRGSVETSVLNPVQAFYREQRERGIRTWSIPGNHDLGTNGATWAGSLVSALGEVGVRPVNELFYKLGGDGDTIFIPWMPSVAALKEQLERIVSSKKSISETDVIIHAPVDGVIVGLPDHGLDAAYLASLGFRRVFAGHYHNHVDFGNGVYSIGATTHQTWSDVGSKAGFLMLYADRVQWFASQAPRFVDLDTVVMDNDEDLVEAVSGNYVRVSFENPTQEQMNETRHELREKGALGVTIRPIKTSSMTPGARSPVKAKLDSLDESVAAYAEKKAGKAVAQAALEILASVRSAA
jgi:DNA repair exonuclease SbcCD nuclease subunit